MFLFMLLMLAAESASTHLIAVVVFIVVMLLWLIGGLSGVFVGEEPYRRIGGSLLPWLAVATLAYLALG